MSLSFFADLIGDGADMAVDASGGDHHEVADGRLALEIDR